MAEMTDAELVERVARAMRWQYWEIPVVVDRGTGETVNQPCYETPDGPLDPRVFDPLAVDEKGKPTESAKAQLWGVLGWLQETAGTLMMGACTDGNPDNVTYWVQCMDVVVGEEFEATPVEGEGSTLARALCEAAVAVGNA